MNVVSGRNKTNKQTEVQEIMCVKRKKGAKTHEI